MALANDLFGLPIAADSVFPFSEIADKLRNHHINHQLDAFDGLAGMVMDIYDADYTGRTRPQDCIRNTIKQKYQSRWEGLTFFEDDADSPHILTSVNIELAFDFIAEHIHRFEVHPSRLIPSSTIVEEGGVTYAKAWIIQCAMHAKPEVDEVTRDLFLSFVQMQPILAQREDPLDYYFRQILVDAQSDMPMTFPGLEEALRPFTPIDERVYLGIIREYLRLGATAAHLWEHMWQEHGIQRGNSLTIDEGHVRHALSTAYRFYDDRLSDWSWDLPLRTRRHLATMNLQGDLLYLIDYVFPKVIIPTGSTIRENEFAWQIQHWIIGLVTSPAHDPTGSIAAASQFGHLNPALSSHSWFQNPAIGSMVLYHDNLPRVPRHQDVVLEAYGPRIQVACFTRPVLRDPAAKEMSCTICQEGHSDDHSSVWVKTACEHAFHYDCMDEWANSSVHADTVPCPNCRKKMCDARPRREMVR